MHARALPLRAVSRLAPLVRTSIASCGTQRRPQLWRIWVRSFASDRSTTPDEKDARTFQALGLSDEVVKAVKEELGFKRPTDVQMAVIPRALRGENLVFSSSTGTGKTLAYVLPIVHCLRHAEAQQGAVVRPQRPRALIVVPSRELALQVADVVRQVARQAPLRTAVLHGGTRRSPQHEKLDGKIDILVATPGRLAEMRVSKRLYVTDVRHVVLDEADTLYDDSFRSETLALITPLLDMASKKISDGSVGRKEKRDISGTDRVQIIALGATLPPALTADLKKSLPNLGVVSARLMTVRHLRQSFVHLQQSEKQNRMLAELQRVLHESKESKVMVFCNTVSSARSTQHALREAGITAASLHGLVPPRRRSAEWDMFATGESRVLVCTDLAARGLDDSQVSHVLLFDFPQSVLDYIHRVGRTARAHRTGHAISFVTKRDRGLADGVEDAVKRHTDLWTLVSRENATTANRASSPVTSRAKARWTPVKDSAPVPVLARNRGGQHAPRSHASTVAVRRLGERRNGKRRDH